MLEENYNKNQRFILGIATLWLFYQLLCITESNIYINKYINVRRKL